jgi:thioredoxin 2
MKAQLVRCGQCGWRTRVPVAGHGIPRCGSCRHPLPWMIDAADEDFAEITKSVTVPVFVYVWAPWCAPCIAARPGLERLARDLAGRAKLVKVNAVTAPVLRQRFVVDAVPTLMVFHGPRIVAYHGGAPPEPSLRAWLEQALRRSERVPATRAGREAFMTATSDTVLRKTWTAADYVWRHARNPLIRDHAAEVKNAIMAYRRAGDAADAVVRARALLAAVWECLGSTWLAANRDDPDVARFTAVVEPEAGADDPAGDASGDAGVGDLDELLATVLWARHGPEPVAP